MSDKRDSGVEQFADALPDVLLQLLDPSARVSSTELRDAIALFVIAWLMFFLVRFLLALVSGTRNLFLGRRLLRRPSGFFSLMGKLGVVAYIAAPAHEIIELVGGASPNQAYVAVMLLGGLTWLFCRAAVRDKVWLDRDERLVHVTRGFAIFRITDTTIDLSETLYDATLRAPVGKTATGRPVYVRKTAFEVLAEALGDKEVATNWLRFAVADIGLVPAGRRFVTSR